MTGGGARGFTLVEMLVALALFALIALAGIRLVDSVLRIERRSADRLDRIAALQRAFYLIGADFEALDDGPRASAGGIQLRRHGAGGEIGVRYAFAGAALVREADGVATPLVPGVSNVAWSFHQPGGDWVATLDPRPQAPRPDAIALSLDLVAHDGAPGGAWRRVVALPVQP